MSEPDAGKLIGEIAAGLQETKPLSRDFNDRVMARIRGARRESGFERALEWLLEPRSIALSPLSGLAMAAGLGALLLLGTVLSSRQPGGSGRALMEAEAAPLVSFVLRAPEARSVSVVGDFNGWDAGRTPLEFQPSTGTWTVVVRLVPGRYAYCFVVDGRVFVADPAAPRSLGDDFGAPTSVLVVGRSGAHSGGGAT